MFRYLRGGRKLVQCEGCGQYAQLLGLDSEEIQVSPVGTCLYEGKCPLCNQIVKTDMADYLGVVKSIVCTSCDTSLLVSRTREDFNIRPSKLSKHGYSQKIVDEIRAKLPEKRPWPTHIHKQIALELGYSNSLVSKIITKLISQGLYPLPESSEKESPELEEG